MRSLLLGLGLAFLGFSPHPRAAVEQSPLVGSWKMVSYQRVLDNGEPQNGLGEHPKGFVILTPEGRAVLLTTADGRKPAASDADRAELWKSMVAYTGKYRIEGDDFITSVDVSWNEVWNGTEQRRHFKIEGDKLILTTSPAPSPIYPGKTYYARVVFEREK
jgi:Lipocalin-like domain